jgi:hypothetical protein
MKAMTEVINAILTTTGQRKRQVAAMFLDLVDRTDWPQYYEVGCFSLACLTGFLILARSFQNLDA